MLNESDRLQTALFVGWTKFYFDPSTVLNDPKFEIYDRDLGADLIAKLVEVHCQNTTEAPLKIRAEGPKRPY